MTSIGTLFAFILVCAGVWVMRVKMPSLPRAFKTPLVPLVPILGIATCLFMMVFLPIDTWIRLIVWMLLGLDIYLAYGVKHSHFSTGETARSGMRIAGITGIILSLLLVVAGLLHQYMSEENDKTLLYISIGFAAFHLVWYGIKTSRSKS
jgi:APA family basic amino acid/polyamine antiporter